MPKPGGKVRRDVTVGFATPPDAVKRLELTSNEWMQKAGELEAEVERREEVARGLALALRDADAEVERLRETLGRVLEKATKHDDGDIEAIVRAALEEK